MNCKERRDFLKAKLARRSERVKLRYKYYDMKNAIADFGVSTPPNLINRNTHLGWCNKAVDSLADRLVFMKFKNDYFDIQNIFDLNNPDILIDSAINAALIGSCSFIYISSSEEDGFPRMQVIDGANATGIIDPITMMLTEGYAILDTDSKGSVTCEAYFNSEETVIWKDGKEEHYPNPALYPLLVPVIYRPSAKRPFGHSRISRACMDIVQSASRTVKRSEISAEFYSFPQKYITGLADDVEIPDKWRATISTMMTFTKDENGDSPKLGQFNQQSMSPHIDQLRMFAALFAGETGLTLDDLGFLSDNPSSSEAIKASHETLRLMARKAQKTFSSCLVNAGFVAASVRDNYPFQRNQIFETKVVWEPIFEPDFSTLSSIGDGAIKLNQAVPGYMTSENLRQMTGIKGED